MPGSSNTNFPKLDNAKYILCAQVVFVATRLGRSGPTPIHNKLTIYAGLLSPGLGRDGSFGIRLSGKRGYVHVIQTSGYNTGKARGAGIKLRGQAGEFGVDQVTLNEGDGVYIHIAANDGELKVENVSGVVAEVLVFDIE